MTETPIHDRAVSVIVCTHNRASALKACLNALRAMEFDARAWELIVVDNRSTDRTREALHAFATAAPFRVTLAYEPKPGLARARNRGVRAARAPLIAFTDDDCYVARDFLAQLMDVFRNSRYGYVGGRILLHDPSDAPATIKEDPEPAEIAAYSVVQPGFIQGANMAFRREVWDAIGGFDPLFGSGAHFPAEDVDFASRASAAGWLGAYVPGPVVRHHHGRKPGPDLERLLSTYARGRGAYYTKGCLNPRMRKEFARHWYWDLRRLVLEHRLREAVREIAAGWEFLFRNLLTPPSRRLHAE